MFGRYQIFQFFRWDLRLPLNDFIIGGSFSMPPRQTTSLNAPLSLDPVPFTTDSLGQSSTVLPWVISDELAEKVDVLGGDGTIAVSK